MELLITDLSCNSHSNKLRLTGEMKFLDAK